MADIPLRPLGANFYGVFLGLGNWKTWNFNADWRPQIDAVKALGCNFVSFFGTDNAWTYANLSVYLARRREFAEYLMKVGMYGLPYGSFSPAGWVDGSNAHAITIFEQDAALLSQFPNIIGYVTVDEPFLSGWGNATTVAYCSAQYAAVKAVVPADFPVCTTPIGISGSNVWDYAGANKIDVDEGAPYCDFFSFHPFHVASASQLTALRAAYPNKQIINPSMAACYVNDSSVTAKATSVMALNGANGVRGSAIWNALDFDSATWGVWNSNMTERAFKADAIRAGIVTAGALTSVPLHPIRPTRRSARLNHLHKWGYK